MPSLRVRTLRLAQSLPSENPLRPALIASVKTATDSSVEDILIDKLFDVARAEIGHIGDVTSPAPGVYVFSYYEDVEDPNEPGDSQMLTYNLVVSFKTGDLQVRQGNRIHYKERMPLTQLWSQPFGRILAKLNQHAPKLSFSGNDTPSVQDFPGYYER